MTGPIVWGEPGTNGSTRSFSYCIKERELAPIDFIAKIHRTTRSDHHALRRQLLSRKAKR